MSSAISVRLDDEALRALARLEATGLSRSEAIRRAILGSAGRLQRRAALAAEVAALEADEDDRREMLEVAATMETTRAAGDVHEFRMPRGAGHEQQGRRHGVIVQASELLPRSVVLVAPTSRSARPASFRPEIDLFGQTTRVLVSRSALSTAPGLVS
jgi:mRNA-degrading endonuclease toxin of MazEF toxin-antitoxin module